MGMDVYGKNPTSPKGEYFRNNVWGWHPLWTFCEDNFPLITQKVKYGHSNDGDGLGAKDSKALSRFIHGMIDDGSAQEYIDQRNKYLSELERPTCKHCKGTGIRTDEVGIEHKMPEQELPAEMAMLTGRTHGYCNACRGEGKCDAWETNYSLDIDNLRNFADFLADCGGFEIC